jgi:peroxiredoxin
MASYRSNFERFEAVNTHVLGISPDASPSKAAWAASLGGLSFDLLSDYYPHGEVAAKYGVLRPDGLTDRSVFLVDRDGVVRFTRKYEIPEQPDVNDVFKAIETLGVAGI